MLRVLLTTGGIQALALLLLFARTKILAWFLGPEMFGAMAVIDKLVTTIAGTVALSLPLAAVRFLPPLWDGDREGFYSLLRRMASLLAMLVSLAVVVTLGVALSRPSLFGAGLLPYRGIIVVASLTLPVVAFGPFLQSAVAAHMQPTRSMLLVLAHACVVALAALIGAPFKGLAGFYAGYALFGSVFIVWALRRFTREHRNSRSRRRLALRLPPGVWKFCFTMLSLAFLTPYAALYVHYKVLTTFDATTAGLMQAAIGISIAVRFILGAGHAVVVTPSIYRAHTIAARMALADVYQSALFVLAGVSVPLLLLFPEFAVRTLYSGSFTSGASFVALFVAVELLGLFNLTYSTIILASDRLRFYLLQNLAAQLGMLLIAWLTIDRYGVVGAAIAAFAAQAMLLAGTLLHLRLVDGLRPRARVWALASYLTIFLVAAGLAGVALSGQGPLFVGARVALYIVMVAPLLLFLTPADRGDIGRLVGGWRGALDQDSRASA